MKGLRRAALEYTWLYDRRRGMGVSEIARRHAVGETAVRDGLRRARASERPRPATTLELVREQLDVIPLFPVGVLSPSSSCPHRGAIPAGSALCCMICHQTGFDATPSDPESGAPAASRPGPEPRPRRTAVAAS
jgi:hypothetical protein